MMVYTALVFNRGKNDEPSRYNTVTGIRCLEDGVVQLIFENGTHLITSWENVILITKEEKQNEEENVCN